MAITVQFTFDDAWAARIGEMVEGYPRITQDAIIVALLAAAGKTWEELTTKQKWKALVLRYTMKELMRHEGDLAAEAAAQVVLDDISANFPLDVGPA